MLILQALHGIVLIDEDHYPDLCRFNWRVMATGYVVRTANRKENGKWINSCEYLHRRILGLSFGDTRLGDHINGNRLDNQKANLRVCDNKQNAWNSRYKNNKSGYTGVSWDKGAWQAKITFNRKFIYLGRFDTPEEAHEVYNQAAKKLRGEFYANR